MRFLPGFGFIRGGRGFLSRIRLPGLVLLLAGAASCTGGSHEAAGPRLVVLFGTCSLNRNTLAPYDPAVSYTPHFRQFASEGVAFTRHQTETGVSGPSFAALFSGVQADRHKAYFHPKDLPQDLTLIAEAFADNGYDTYFWSGHVMASAGLGYGQGVPPGNVIVSEEQPPPVLKTYLTRQDPRFMEILERLRADPDYRAYVQIDFTLTHGPYYHRTTSEERRAFYREHPETLPGMDPAEADRILLFHQQHYYQLNWNWPAASESLGFTPTDVSKLARALEFSYRAAVAGLDEYFGSFLEAIQSEGLYDESLIAFTADHGEMLYRENTLFHWTHGKQLSPEVLLVPLLIRGPAAGVRPGTVDKVTRSVDVFPTLAGLCRLKLPSGLDLEGVDLSPVVRGEEEPPDLLAFSHTSLLSNEEYERNPDLTLRNTLFPAKDPKYIWALVRDGDLAFKLRRTAPGRWEVQVFDWTHDPGETRDLYDPGDAAQERMVERLSAYRDRIVAGFPWENQNEVPREERLRRLRSLGYIH